MFKKELKYFIDNQDELVKKYLGKFLVISNEHVQGAFDSTIEADKFAQNNFQNGEYIIQPCEKGIGAYTIIISTNQLIG